MRHSEMFLVFIFMTYVADASTGVLKTPVFYEDKFVKVTPESLILKWYYFPYGNAKTIPFGDIEAFLREPISCVSAKGWGMGMSNVWYACDMQRQFKSDQNHFLSVKLTGSSLRKGFSVENFAKFEAALAEVKNRDGSTLTVSNLFKPSSRHELAQAIGECLPKKTD